MTDVLSPNPQATTPVAEATTPVTPSAAPASRPPLPWERPAPEPVPAQAPVQQAEPVQPEAVTPPPTPAPQAPDPEIERLRTQAAQFEQLQEAVQQERDRQARESEAAQRNEEYQTKVREIWDIANRYDTDEERQAYLLRQMTALNTEREQQLASRVEQERQALEQERIANAIAGYPDWLGREFDLDAADIEDLRQLNDYAQMTATAKSMKRMKERYGELRQIAEQTYANTQAAQLRPVASGSVSGAPGAQEITPFRSGDPQSRAILADIFQKRN